MEIERTYKPKSLKHGLIEVVDEAKAREVFGQTYVARHATEGECGKKGCIYCCEVALSKLLAGGVVETFFSSWKLVQ